ncbi:hypothetical protein MTO96_042277 [Rhipicephalus appendiculatus]
MGAKYHSWCAIHYTGKQVNVCYACGRLGHHAYVCPCTSVIICRGCGASNPDEQRQCFPKCRLRGGQHLTASKDSSKRFKIPYVVRRRRGERARATPRKVPKTTSGSRSWLQGCKLLHGAVPAQETTPKMEGAAGPEGIPGLKGALDTGLGSVSVKVPPQDWLIHHSSLRSQRFRGLATSGPTTTSNRRKFFRTIGSLTLCRPLRRLRKETTQSRKENAQVK